LRKLVVGDHEHLLAVDATNWLRTVVTPRADYPSRCFGELIPVLDPYIVSQIVFSIFEFRCKRNEGIVESQS
jgi:hypothetical protein